MARIFQSLWTRKGSISISTLTSTLKSSWKLKNTNFWSSLDWSYCANDFPFFFFTINSTKKYKIKFPTVYLIVSMYVCNTYMPLRMRINRSDSVYIFQKWRQWSASCQRYGGLSQVRWGRVCINRGQPKKVTWRLDSDFQSFSRGCCGPQSGPADFLGTHRMFPEPVKAKIAVCNTRFLIELYTTDIGCRHTVRSKTSEDDVISQWPLVRVSIRPTLWGHLSSSSLPALLWS